MEQKGSCIQRRSAPCAAAPHTNEKAGGERERFQPCTHPSWNEKRKKRTKEKKNAEQLSEWKQDQTSSVHGAELSYKAGYRPWLSENELTSNIRRNFGLSNWLRENVAVPVRRRHTEAAPHTYTVQPFFPSVGCLANECS